MQKAAARGVHSVSDLIRRRHDIPSHLLDVYEAFYLLDRDGMSGRATVGSMRDLLDEMEVGDRSDRMTIIRIWRGMDAERHEASERLKKAEEG